jgi:hypothetical protein
VEWEGGGEVNMSSDGNGEDGWSRKSSSQCTVGRICEALDSILALCLVPDFSYRLDQFSTYPVFTYLFQQLESRSSLASSN